MTHGILFIDGTVGNYNSLIQGVAPQIKVVLLDSYRDGIEQITETLTRNRGATAVHIVSHGDAASLYLGNSQLSAANSDRYSHQLRQWKLALADSADILIYSCNFGTDRNFLEQLHQLTGANTPA